MGVGGEDSGGGDYATLRLTPRHLTNVSARSGREVGETRNRRDTEIVSVLSPRNLSLSLAPHLSLPLSSQPPPARHAPLFCSLDADVQLIEGQNEFPNDSQLAEAGK